MNSSVRIEAAEPAFRVEDGRLWLCGDSIFRGYALGRFPEVFTPEEAAATPLWPLRSPASVINMILGREAASKYGLTGLPDDGIIDYSVGRFETHYAAGRFRQGDAMVLLDVGQHACDPDRHASQWTRLLDHAAATGCALFVCEAFDNLVPGERLKTGEPTEQFRHDHKFGARSHNDALRATADGRATFIETQEPIRRYDAMLQRLDLTAYHNDRFHLNVWGQLRLAKLILNAVAPELEVRPAKVRRLMRTAWQAAAPRKAQDWTLEKADKAVRMAFRET